MDATTFLIILLACAGLIVAGILTNLYLYSSGALGTRTLKSSRGLRTAVAASGARTNDHHLLSRGIPEKAMASHVRRTLMLFLFFFIIVGIVVGVIISGIVH